MRLIVIALFSFAACGSAIGDEVRVTGANTTLKQLAGSPSLVTVVLKEGGARDTNLKVVDVQSTHFTVVTPKGDKVPYLNDTVQEVIVQPGAVKKNEFALSDTRALRAEDQRVVDRAYARAAEIYAAANSDQDLKIRAAILLALHKDANALDYLKKLTQANEIKTVFEGAKGLYLIGSDLPENVLRQGLTSGNLKLRGDAAQLAGLTGYKEATQALLDMSNDRAAELCAPATRALARLGNRDVIPQALNMIGDLNQEKASAAVFALTTLGGADVIQQLKARLQKTKDTEKFRIAGVLYELDDPDGKKLLIEQFQKVPSFAPEAALQLGKDGNQEALAYLRDRLRRREDINDRNLVYRARVAAALYESGDPSAMSVFQELLRSNNKAARAATLEQFTELGKRKLITILQPAIENVDNAYALAACNTAVTLAVPDFRERTLSLSK